MLGSLPFGTPFPRTVYSPQSLRLAKLTSWVRWKGTQALRIEIPPLSGLLDGQVFHSLRNSKRLQLSPLARHSASAVCHIILIPTRKWYRQDCLKQTQLVVPPKKKYSIMMFYNGLKFYNGLNYMFFRLINFTLL